MLFDKASRTWNVKLPGESAARVAAPAMPSCSFTSIGYLNLLGAPDGRGLWRDVLGLPARRGLPADGLDYRPQDDASALPALACLADLLALPILLLLWQVQMGIPSGPRKAWRFRLVGDGLAVLFPGA